MVMRDDLILRLWRGPIGEGTKLEPKMRVGVRAHHSAYQISLVELWFLPTLCLFSTSDGSEQGGCGQIPRTDSGTAMGS